MSGLSYVKNPLTEGHCKTVDQVLLSYPRLKATFEALERCGMDCSQYLQQLQGQYNVCVPTRREFNPMAQPLESLMQLAPQGVAPMPDSQAQAIDALLQNHPSLKATIEAIARCGADCKPLLDQIEAQYQIGSDLKREFNPLSP